MKTKTLFILLIASVIFIPQGCQFFRKPVEPQVIVVPVNPTGPIEIKIDPSKPVIITQEDKVPTIIDANQKIPFDGFTVSNLIMIGLYDGDWTKDFVSVKKDDICKNKCYLLSEKITEASADKKSIRLINRIK